MIVLNLYTRLRMLQLFENGDTSPFTFFSQYF